MTDLSNTCEGTNGVAISAAGAAGAPDPWGSSSAGTGTITYDTSQAHQGSSCADFHLLAATAATMFLDWNALTAATNAYMRAYIYLTAKPSGTMRILQFQTTLICAAVRLTSTGALATINQSGVVIATTTATVPLNQWVRVEFEITGVSGSTGTVNARMYSGANLETNTPDANGSLSTAGQSVRGQPTVALFGFNTSTTNTSAYDLRFDDCAYSDVAQPGPSVTTTTSLPELVMAPMQGV